MNQKTKMGYTSQKGITLIALVITIIVLLILAGVTISMVLGEDGIIAQAQEAKQAQENAELKEKIELWNANVEAAEYSNKKITEEEYNKFKTEVEALAEKAGIEGVDITTGKVEIDGEEVAVQMPSNIDPRRDIKFYIWGTETEWGYFTAKEGMTWEEYASKPDLHVSSTGYGLLFWTNEAFLGLSVTDLDGDTCSADGGYVEGTIGGDFPDENGYLCESWSAEIIADELYWFIY